MVIEMDREKEVMEYLKKEIKLGLYSPNINHWARKIVKTLLRRYELVEKDVECVRRAEEEEPYETEVIFFSSGNTAAWNNRGQQIPSLQKSWLLLYAEFLVSKGIDVLSVKFNLPGGKQAKLFKIEDGFNWEIIDKEPT